MAKFWGVLFLCLTFVPFRSYGAHADQGLAEEAADFALNVFNHNSKDDFLYKLVNFDFRKIQVSSPTPQLEIEFSCLL